MCDAVKLSWYCSVLEWFHGIACGMQKESRCSSQTAVELWCYNEYNDRGTITSFYDKLFFAVL